MSERGLRTDPAIGPSFINVVGFPALLPLSPLHPCEVGQAARKGAPRGSQIGLPKRNPFFVPLYGVWKAILPRWGKGSTSDCTRRLMGVFPF